MRSRRSLLLGPARLCFRLLLLLGYRRRCPPVLRNLVLRWRYGKVCLRSLLYNSFGGSDTAIDSAFEPVYWLVDNVIRWFGVVFVALVIVLTSSIVAIAYLCVLPLILHTYSVPRICWHFVYSHWNLILIVFHYYQAITTPPGYPPQAKTDLATVSICKKCIYPKPARTHHCSICNRCSVILPIIGVLEPVEWQHSWPCHSQHGTMGLCEFWETRKPTSAGGKWLQQSVGLQNSAAACVSVAHLQLCPACSLYPGTLWRLLVRLILKSLLPAWLNNCVGHYNHRYFFSFCFFMTLGCVYCSFGSWDMFREAYAALEKMKQLDRNKLQVAANQTYHQTPPPTFSFRERMTHKSLVYLWFLCSSVALALGALTVWHAVLISRGETSIERHINKKERHRLSLKGKVFRNPYNYGCLDNWKVFLGVNTRRHWLTRVLLPSSHLPYGNGMTWGPPPYVTTAPDSVLAV
uniref:Palmitoyltransferase n=1 Tax=Sarcophilus harrisii TaxID=9305 RepID=A0A7N4PIU2_SARHA